MAGHLSSPRASSVTDCENAVKALFAMMRAGIRSRMILTREAIENAIVVVYVRAPALQQMHRHRRPPRFTLAIRAAVCISQIMFAFFHILHCSPAPFCWLAT